MVCVDRKIPSGSRGACDEQRLAAGSDRGARAGAEHGARPRAAMYDARAGLEPTRSCAPVVFVVDVWVGGFGCLCVRGYAFFLVSCLLWGFRFSCALSPLAFLNVMLALVVALDVFEHELHNSKLEMDVKHNLGRLHDIIISTEVVLKELTKRVERIALVEKEKEKRRAKVVTHHPSTHRSSNLYLSICYLCIRQLRCALSMSLSSVICAPSLSLSLLARSVV